MRVLVVDDDPLLLAGVRRWLEGDGAAVDAAGSAEEGLQRARGRAHDVIVLDVMLGGDVDGYDVCTRLRAAGIATPILMLTARDAVPDRVRGLRSGADDYLVKPFALDELAARIEALARRHLRDRAAVLRFGDLELDTARHVVLAAGRPLLLTEKEVAVLHHLLLHPCAPQPQEDIFASAWGWSQAPLDNLVDQYVVRLRRKLVAARSSTTVVSVKRRGYCLAAATAPARAEGDGRPSRG